MPTSLTIEIDSSEIDKLMKAIQQAGIGFEKHDRIITRALNKGMDRYYTRLKRLLGEETGIKVKRRITQGFKKYPASGGRWQAAIVVRDWHTPVNKKFYGAQWSRSLGGARHAAWADSEEAEGAFMIPGSGTAFKRTSDARGPVKRLWGPNMARELERNGEVVEATGAGIVKTYVLPEAYRQIDLELKRVKGRHGL